MDPEDHEERLIKQAQQGDQDAFLKLYDLYLEKVYKRVRSKVPYQHAEDVTQDIFIAVIRSLGHFKHHSRFSTWLYTIVSRQIADFYRRNSRQGTIPTDNMDAEQIRSSVSVPFNAHERSDEWALLQQALLKLPEHYQDVIFLRFVDGLTFAEIAAQRGQSLEAVKSLYRRAIEALRDQMGEV